MPLTTNMLKAALDKLAADGFIGLCTSEPVEGNLHEPAESSGYHRMEISKSIAQGGAGGFTTEIISSAANAKNTTKFYFPEADADWGTITWLCIVNNMGSLLYKGELSNSVTVNKDNMPKFPAESISITLTSSDTE